MYVPVGVGVRSLDVMGAHASVTYFTRRNVKLQMNSLRNLVSISKHSRPVKQVRSLEVTPEHHSTSDRAYLDQVTGEMDEYCTEHRDEYNAEQFKHTAKSVDSLRSRFCDILASDVHIGTSGLVAAWLTRALTGFVSLESLRFAPAETE
ncbi:hypothetical protein IWX49DRAFT_551763 [Phyllosticta citricarpa]